MEQATRSTGEFSEKLKIAAREYAEGTSEGASLTLKQRINAVVAQATNLNMAIANVVALLTYDATDREASGFISTSSADAMISLKLGPHLLKVLLDVFFSMLGVYSHPLFFSFHLFHLFNARAARIVLKSITTNLSRLTTTLILALLLSYFFAIVGYLFFSDRHINDNVSNLGGPCSNLLTCFVSYSFAGFLQTGLMYWLKRPAFPQGEVETAGDILGDDGTLIIFEAAFMMIMSVAVISIITGIIVDTFGELRVAQDVAARYRRSTCFITGALCCVDCLTALTLLRGCVVVTSHCFAPRCMHFRHSIFPSPRAGEDERLAICMSPHVPAQKKATWCPTA